VQLFSRQYALILGDRDLSDLDLSFKVERKTRGAAGVAEIRLSNPSPETIAAASRGAQIRLSAGYPEAVPLIFSGTVRSSMTERTGPDRVLVVQGRDGAGAFAEAALLSRAYPEGTSIATVARDAIRALGIGIGNFGDLEGAVRLRTGATTFAAGYTAHGPATRILTDILSGAGMRWSVQHGSILVLQRGAPLSGAVEALSADSGLLDYPTWDERRRVLTAKALIRPGLEPGRRVVIDSEAAQGGFEVRGATWTGDTQGGDWFVSMTLRAL